MNLKKLSEKKWYNGAVVACIGVAFYVLLTNLSTVLSAVGGFLGNFKVVFLGIVFAYILNPLAKFFSDRVLKKMKKPGRRWAVSVILAVVTALLALLFLIGTLIPQLVTSIASFAVAEPQSGGRVFVVQDAAEAARLAAGGGLSDRCVLIAQTTFSPAEFERIRCVLEERAGGIRVFNSICSATMERQEALRALAAQVEGIVVVGGKSSANTRRLYERAKSLVPLADLIEDASMLRPEFFRLERVGITAGASTPEAVVKAVEERLLQGGSR